MTDRDELVRRLRSADKRLIGTLGEEAASAISAQQQGPTEAPKWLVRASGDHYDTWLCVYRADVRNAIAEAIFGSIESAEEKEVDDYMKAIDLMPAEELSRRWNFEDGWLEVLRMAGK